MAAATTMEGNESKNAVDSTDFASRNLSNIRNKKRRKELYLQMKYEHKKVKSKLKKAKRKLIQEQGMVLYFICHLHRSPRMHIVRVFELLWWCKY